MKLPRTNRQKLITFLAAGIGAVLIEHHLKPGLKKRLSL